MPGGNTTHCTVNAHSCAPQYWKYREWVPVPGGNTTHCTINNT